MKYTKKRFGSELKMKLKENDENYKVSRWAFSIYTNHCLEFESGLDSFIFKLIAMEEGPEFFLSKEEISALADELIMEI